jgi:hypothetical protein
LAAKQILFGKVVERMAVHGLGGTVLHHVLLGMKAVEDGRPVVVAVHKGRLRSRLRIRDPLGDVPRNSGERTILVDVLPKARVTIQGLKQVLSRLSKGFPGRLSLLLQLLLLITPPHLKNLGGRMAKI